MIIKFLDKAGYRYLEKKCFEEHVRVTEILSKVNLIDLKLIDIIQDYLKAEKTDFRIEITKVPENRIFPNFFRIVKDY